jgi:hypothetical protein
MVGKAGAARTADVVGGEETEDGLMLTLVPLLDKTDGGAIKGFEVGVDTIGVGGELETEEEADSVDFFF